MKEKRREETQGRRNGDGVTLVPYESKIGRGVPRGRDTGENGGSPATTTGICDWLGAPLPLRILGLQAILRAPSGL